MAYADVSDIESEFINLSVGATNSVNTTEVQAFLDQEDQFINSQIQWRYDIPIVSSEAILLLKKIEIQLVAFRVADILEIKGTRPGFSTDTAQARIVQEIRKGAGKKWAQETLLDLKLARMDLPVEVKLSHFEGLDSFSRTSQLSPEFKKEKRQW